MDLAEIGFRVETAELKEGQAELTKLGSAAKTAGANVKRGSDIVNQSLSETGTAAQRAAAGMGKTTSAAGAAASGVIRVGEAADVAAGKLKRMQAAANQNFGAMKANTANIAAQFQDIGVTAAMGMNPLNIALQQGTQLASVFAAMKPAEAVKALAGAFGGLFGVVSLVTLGTVAIIAALIQFVNWANLAKTALNAFADILPTIAPYLVTIGAALALAFAPEIAAAIWGITAAISVGLMNAILAIVATVGAVPILIGAVIAGLFIFRDEIAKVLGVDLIGVVKGAVNSMIGGFVGGYKAIVAVWRQLPAAFGDLAVQAGNALISGIENAINSASVAVQRFWNSIPGVAKAGLSANFNNVSLPRINNPNAGAASGVLMDAAAAAKSAAGVDYVGAAYDFVGNMAEKAAGKVRGLANAIDLTDATKAKGRHGKTDAEKFSDIVNGAERSIASLQAERDAIGLSEIATARLKYETQLLNEAKQKNIDLSPTQRATLMGLANDMAALEVATAKAKDQLAFSKDLFKGFLGDLEQGLKNGEGFWKSFGNAALNALNKVIDKLLNDMIDALFQVNDAAGGGSSSGILGSVFKLFGFAKGGAFATNDNNVQRFAKGGDFTNSIVSRSTPFRFANGTALGEMGEAGPEGILPLKRLGNGDLGVSAVMPVNQNGGGGSAGPRAPLAVTVSVVGANGDKQIKEMVRQGVEEGISQYDTAVLPIRVNEIGSDPRVR